MADSFELVVVFILFPAIIVVFIVDPLRLCLDRQQIVVFRPVPIAVTITVTVAVAMRGWEYRSQLVEQCREIREKWIVTAPQRRGWIASDLEWRWFTRPASLRSR